MGRIRAKLALFFWLSLTSLAIENASATAPVTNIYSAGFAFVGDYSAVEKNYPYTSGLFDEKDGSDVPLIEQELRLRLQSVSNSSLNIITDELANYETGEAISMAFAMDWENVSIEKLAGLYKVVIDLHAQILAFDFTTKKLVASYPIAIQFRDSFDKQPSQQQVSKIIHDLFYSRELGLNILDEFVRRLNVVTLRPSYGNYIRVSSVTLDPQAVATMSSHSEVELRSFQVLIGNSLTKFLSTNQNVGVLPYSVDAAIGGKLVSRFANGDVYNFEIPKADYQIDLTIRGFKKASLSRNTGGATWAYGSYVHLLAKATYSGNVILDGRFKNAVTKTIPKSQVVVDNWSAYTESLFSLLDEFTNEISDPDSDWLRSHAEFDNAKKQMRALQGVLDRCR